MENPESRPEVAKFINEIIVQHYSAQAKGTIGWSLAMRIYDALKRAGYLVEGA